MAIKKIGNTCYPCSLWKIQEKVNMEARKTDQITGNSSDYKTLELSVWDFSKNLFIGGS